jgi:hypothetical protein
MEKGVNCKANYNPKHGMRIKNGEGLSWWLMIEML